MVHGSRVIRSCAVAKSQPERRHARTYTPRREAGNTISTIPEQFAPFDPADDIDAAAAYLEAVFEEAGDDPAFVAQALGRLLAPAM
jgi:hypothetical protein